MEISHNGVNKIADVEDFKRIYLLVTLISCCEKGLNP